MEVSSFGILRAKFTVISTVLVVILDVFIIINIYAIKQTNSKQTFSEFNLCCRINATCTFKINVYYYYYYYHYNYNYYYN